ncbi:MAG: hypothetical protein COZ06_33715 [Armatimonadetes bacterium CG_4_10_14_3_um_filter_66_18]|nr:MAG: hypothetical protein COZ06_33715 [Armatimonadetes bacterium CG_4_10_14_3_um_filter_66_18]PJB60451.1 MAG: hypothetical protein CO096_33890 [Armatimonadetes bacterium CG_4_9_14_3_um_filter_66_14]
MPRAPHAFGRQVDRAPRRESCPECRRGTPCGVASACLPVPTTPHAGSRRRSSPPCQSTPSWPCREAAP